MVLQGIEPSNNIGGELEETESSSSFNEEDLFSDSQAKHSESHILDSPGAYESDNLRNDGSTPASLLDAHIESTSFNTTDLLSSKNVLILNDSEEKNFFTFLADEIILRMAALLDVPSIGRLAQVCRRFRMLTDDIPLWKEISLERRYLSNAGVLATQQPLTKSYFIKRFHSFRIRETQQREQALRTLKTQMKESAIDNCLSFLMLSGLSSPYEWLITVCLLLVTIFSSLKLDGVIDWSWPIVFIPFYIVIVNLLYTPIIYEISSFYFERDFEDKLVPNETCFGPVFYFILFVIPLGYSAVQILRFLIYSVFVTTFAFIICFVVKVSVNNSSLAWWGVFLPLLIECFILILLLISGATTWTIISQDEKWIDRALLIMCSCLMFLFFLFCSLKLDGNIEWSWFQVLVPLFMMKGLLVLIPIGFSLLMFFGSYSMKQKTRWKKAPSALCFLASILAIFVYTPLFTFEILLAQHAEGSNHLRFVVMFIPLFIIEGLSLIGCVVLNGIALSSD